jgi:hypothetical protein
MAFDLLPDRIDRRMLPEEAIGERLIFTQEAKQEVLRFNVRRAELRGFVAREEDHASGLFCVTFKHLGTFS